MRLDKIKPNPELPHDAKPVPGFDNYFATRDGRIFSTSKGRVREIAKSSYDKDGYLKATLAKDKRSICLRKHRVVALTFIGYSDLMINHKNGNKSDNRVENLEYVDERENQSHWRKDKGYGVGVCFDRKSQKWRAYYQQDHKWVHLGFFNKKEEAKEAYLKKLESENKTNRYAI